MIIFGSTSLNSTIGTGTFFCPRCSMSRQYKHIGVNSYFTLYFIPLIPLGRRGDYVECLQCTGTYGAEVLNYQPDHDGHLGQAEPDGAKLWQDLRRCLIVLMHHAQRTDNETQGRLKSWYEGQAGQGVTFDLITAEIKQAAQANPPIEPFVQQTFGHLAEDGKIFVLEAGRSLLLRQGRLEERERGALRQLGSGLSIPSQLVETTLLR